MTFTIPYFGKLGPALEERYETTLALNGREIKLDLNLEPLELTTPMAKALERFLGDVATHAGKAKSFIEKELGNPKDTTVKEFLEFHLEELLAETLAELLDAKSRLSKQRQLLNMLVVERIGLYPNEEGDGFAIFDHTFEGNRYVKGRRTITDQIIAVYLNAKGTVGHLSHES